MNHARKLVVLAGWALCVACSDDDGGSNTNTGGSAGSSNSGGSNASGGSAGSGGSVGGSAGSAGTGGSGGSDASGGSAGSGGAEGGSGGSSGSGGGGSLLSFFATSKGSGELGGNLGGLEGADAICQMLANAVGAGDRTWAAYLSTSSVNAIDRIGSGPWFNAAGDQVAANPEALHDEGLPNGSPNLVMDENGDPIPASEHDILTGSLADGTVASGLTCADWTSNSAGEQVQVGHSDVPSNPQFSPSWNAAHATNCSPAGLEQTGGSGRIYCFAVD